MATVEQKLSTPTISKNSKLLHNNVNTPTNVNSPRQSSNPLVMLVGKLVFLDLNSSYKPLGKVKQCLNLIGAKIADCLSKDVDYVISNREAATNLDTSLDSTKKSKTSPNALNLGSRFINRTQSILEKASKGFTTSDILGTARRLGIKVLNISDLERYMEKYLNKQKKTDGSTPKNKTELIRQSSFQLDKLSSQKIYKLKNPFLKIESICKQYKPNYEEFKTWHEINFDIFTSKSTSSPFQIYFSDDIKADDENEDDRVMSSQNQQPNKNIFKSPASSTINAPTAQAAKSNVLLNCSNNYNNQQGSKTSMSKNPQSNINSIKSKISMFNNNNNVNNTPGSKAGGTHMLQFNKSNTKRKPTGYCECCKQRYDNLKHHLTSVTHENFDKNASNFKELDEYVDGVLNFRNFLISNNLDNYSKVVKKESPKIDINMEETKEFAKEFNKKRQSLGISQAQVINALNSYHEPVYDETALARFERLDITPRSAARMKPALERWLNDAQLKFGDRLKNLTTPTQQRIKSENQEGSKKRKRFEFPPGTLVILNEAFGQSCKPSACKLEKLSKQVKEDQEEISLWFSEKRENLKKNKKKFKQSNILNGLLNDSSLDDDSLSLNSSPEQKEASLKPSAPATDSHSKKISNMKDVLESTSMKPKQNPYISLKHVDINQISNSLTPIRMNPTGIPSYEMSSPSAQMLFNLNSNSFTIPNETSLSINNSHNNNANICNSASKKLASRLELINGNAELQSIVNDENNLHPPANNSSKSADSTDLSICVDDSIFKAFYHDVSYEIVQK